eukprot:495954-Pleurochrysis_carterae.AAC.1
MSQVSKARKIPVSRPLLKRLKWAKLRHMRDLSLFISPSYFLFFERPKSVRSRSAAPPMTARRRAARTAPRFT